MVNPGGICWTMTMPGISAGRRFITSKVASVPPVEAPRPMRILLNAGEEPRGGSTWAGVPPAAAATTKAEVEGVG